MRSLTRLMALAILMLAIPAASFAGIFVSISVAPPPLPVYVQPVCPQPGFMWTPGYWSWGDEGYYWVPGTWVPAPSAGMLWTPGYWGWSDGYYRWNAGYWGPHIGFYGGVNYGFGYSGVGFVGGEWRGGGFFYNSAVMNVGGAHITNVYVNKTVIVNHTTVNNVSFNGGTGGIRSMPTPAEQAAIHERHIQPTPQQSQHETAAARNPQLLAKNNAGRPAIAATSKPADFSPRSVVPAKAAGGRVEPTTLNASAKTMPSSPRTPASAPRPAVNAARPGPAANTPRSVPKPSNSYNKPATSTTHSQQSMSRPPNSPVNHESRPVVPTHNAPPHTSAPAEHNQKGASNEREKK
jgi:hypothetical protein